MAAQTPVTIDSTPPNDAYRIPSITPDVIPQNTNTESLTRSSPQLLSPRAFVQPRAQPLKSGSRAQKVPAGASAGFASAASIWKLQSKDQDNQSARGLLCDGTVAVEDMPESKGRKTKTKASGKLSRQKKATEAQNDTSSALQKGSEQLSTEFDGPQQPAVGAVIERRGSHKDRDARSANALNTKLPLVHPVKHVANADAILAEPHTLLTELPVKNQRRKRAPKELLTGEKPAQKKPRRSHAKSETIILDSDEPEITLDEAQDVEARAAKKRNNLRLTESRPKPVRTLSSPSEKPNSIAGHAAKAKKLTQLVPSPVKHSAETSAYFAQVEPAVLSDRPPAPSPPTVVVEGLNDLRATRSVCADHVVENSELSNASHIHAPRRRRSWTPIQDSHGDYTAHSILTVGYNLDEGIGQIKFSEMLGNFSYLDPKAEAVPAHTSENASQQHTVTAAESRRPTVSKPQTGSGAVPISKPPTKKYKAPKRPQTITSLATAAYQPVLQAEPAQITVSEFFAPRKERETPIENGADEHEKAMKEATNAKKPRKSRAKAKTAEGDLVKNKKHAKSQTRTKGRVKFNPADYQPPLYSPTQARKQMRSQDFLFGTSSQLAAEESPEFIREVQHAIRQSEMTSGLPNGSQVCTQLEVSPQSVGKSYSRVPTAPHGTCLSVEQATRELWCVSARDETGSKLLQEANDSHDDDVFIQAKPDTTLAGRPDLPHQSPIDPCKDHVSNLPYDEALTRPLDGFHHNGSVESSRGETENPALVVQASIDGERSAPQGTEWVFLPSDDSDSLPHDPMSKSASQPIAHNALGSVNRPALQPLDANLNMAIYDAGSKRPNRLQVRPFSTVTVTCERQRLNSQPLESLGDLSLAVPKRGRGRPRKEGSADRTPLTSPVRGRGRQRKQSLTGSISKTSPVRPRGRPRKEPTIERETTPKRPVGRPRKQSISTTSPRNPSKERSRQHPIPTSQLSSRKEWTNIDDISDSDSPKTPSPRRRRASSSPPFVRELDFEGRQSPSPKPQSSTASGGMKATDSEWPAVQAVIYPKISEAIKSTPPSTNLKNPSWYEKILLYHPIVLEDLTAWLNKQGLRTHIQRLKPKVKQRGRKKKDAPPEVDEWETIEDNLKAWMVQKWCEDHSICCLWKDGLRGGVKARY